MPALERLLSLPEQETRAAVTQLLAHLGHAFPLQLTQNSLLPQVLAQAGDLDFQVRRVCTYCCDLCSSEVSLSGCCMQWLRTSMQCLFGNA